MAIQVEIGFIAVQALADLVRQPADRQNISWIGTRRGSSVWNEWADAIKLMIQVASH